MRRQEIEISNRLGLHARAAAKVVHTATAYSSDIYLSTGDEEVNAKSILGLLTLAASKGTPLWVRADGEDEDAAVEALVELFAGRFGEAE